MWLPLPHRRPQQGEAFSAANQSLIAGPRGLQAVINNARPVQVVPPDNSLVPAHVPSTPRALDLQDPADPVLLGDVQDLAHARASALRVQAASAAHDLLAAHRRPARHRARSVHPRIVHVAVDSSTPRRRKAQ